MDAASWVETEVVGLKGSKVRIVGSPRIVRVEAIATADLDGYRVGSCRKGGRVTSLRLRVDLQRPARAKVGAIAARHASRRTPLVACASGERLLPSGRRRQHHDRLARPRAVRIVHTRRSANPTHASSRANVTAAAAVVGVRVDIRFTPIGDSTRAIQVTRIAANVASSRRTTRRVIVRAARRATGSAIRGAGVDVRLTAIRHATRAVLVSRTARDAARACRTTRRTVVAAASCATGAAIRGAGIDVRFTAIRYTTRAVLIPRIARNSAHPIRTSRRAIVAVAHVPAGAAVVDIGFDIRFTPIRYATRAIQKACIAHNTARAIGTSRRAVVAAASRAATSAICGTGLEIRFTTIRRTIDAISPVGITRDAAHTKGTRRRPAIGAASGVTVPALGDAGVGVGFAAIRCIQVTILERGVTRRNQANSVRTGANAIGWRTFLAALIAIVQVDLEVDFASVRGIAIAIIKAVVARSDATNTERATRRAVRNDTLVSAVTAVVDIGVFIGFATGGRIIVAIPIGRLTVAAPALRRDANGRAVGQVRAQVAAGIAVLDADIEVGLAAIGHIVVAIAIAIVARNGAFARGTSRNAVRAVANRGARAAVSGI